MLINAFATPELSIQPLVKSFPITFSILVLVAMTVTGTVVECVSPSDVPVTIKVIVEGETEGSRLKVIVEEAAPPAGGVMGLGMNVAETPFGSPDTLSVTD